MVVGELGEGLAQRLQREVLDAQLLGVDLEDVGQAAREAGDVAAQRGGGVGESLRGARAAAEHR